MKKLSVVMYVILFLALAGIYLLHFSGNKESVESYASGSIISIPEQGIAYINIDTVILNFDMYLDRSEDLRAKQQKAEAELTSKGTKYDTDVRDYQDKVNKGLVTRATAAQMEQALIQQQQEFASLRDQLQSDLMEEEQVMNRQILEYITSFLEENRSEYNYQYILGKSFGSVVLYGDASLDITLKVLDAINTKYRTEKK